jgi:cell wall-associated NlpC family hydrolase
VRDLEPKRLLAALACTAALLPVAAAQADSGSWNRADQRAVSKAGVIPNLAGGFQGSSPLTPGELASALATVAPRLRAQPVRVAGTTITVVAFDRALVLQLGLGDLATAIQTEARRAGLRPPSYFGSEVVARELGLRYNHPAKDDRLELYPTDQITRAEAAYSFARVLMMSRWQPQDVRSTFATFKLPHYTSSQRAALSLAVSKIGMPYVWGGTTDDRSDGLAHGGYDCSGFVWRVFKLSGNPAGRRIGGRTAAQMAGEIPKSQRIALSKVQAGDTLFFGPAKLGGRATEAGIVHTGIALSSEFMINSSDEGVFVESLGGWRSSWFSWARRVL